MNCTTEYSSSSRFSSGVPDNTRANRERRPLIIRLVFASQFLMRCPSSRMMRSQLSLEQLAAQRVGLRLAANLGDAPREAVEHQPPLDEFFRVGIDVDRASPPLQVLDSFEQVLHVIDIAAAQLAECLVSLRVQLLGQKQAQRCPIAVLQVNADCPAFIW